MTDDQVRRKLFWLLQRLSSYSLWQRKRAAWAYFAEKYEEALKVWPEEITNGFHPQGIIRVYETLRLYDEGLAKLATGNRQVWQFETGEFYQLDRPANLVNSFFYLPCHDRGGQVEKYPPAIEKINKLKVAAEFWGDNVLYPPHDNVSNFFDAGYLLEPDNYRYMFKVFPYPVFPATIEPVPEHSGVIIRTGDMVPCDGIWEPVEIQYNHKLLVIKSDIIGFKNLGAYNYFIRGMNAPLQVFLTNLKEEGFGYIDVHWRLVWEDTRYCDGVIPDESEYFLDDERHKRITCQSGEECPYSGHWVTISGGHQQFIDVQSGTLMPKASKYQSSMYDANIYIPAVWTLLNREDGESVYTKIK